MDIVILKGGFGEPRETQIKKTLVLQAFRRLELLVLKGPIYRIVGIAENSPQRSVNPEFPERLRDGVGFTQVQWSTDFVARSVLQGFSFPGIMRGLPQSSQKVL